MRHRALLVALFVTACGGDGEAPPPPSDEPAAVVVVHLGEVVDDAGEGSVTIDAASVVEVHLDGEARIVELDAGADAALSGGAEAIEGEAYAGGVWFRPRATDAAALRLELSVPARATVWARGAPVPAAERARSLAWTDATLLDDLSFAGPARVLGAAAADGHGGVLLDRWFRRFATTLHSERAGPAQLMDEIAAAQGADPGQWDLDALPFKVTGVHNRIDLGPRDGGCGQLRVSMASIHPIYAPLHLLFLFRQEPAADDVAPDGSIHCLGTARRWARLSALSEAAFDAAARAILDATLVHERFLLAESVELTVSPWEWRQWTPAGEDVLDNPPLFQTAAVPLVNQPGALRDAFLAFVAAHADGLAARTVELPAELRAQSARVPPSGPAESLSLDGLDPGVLAAHPDLAFDIEIVGCPTCHTDDANFVQTAVDRTFSPFYDRELDARAERLDAMSVEAVPTPPFGPLQPLD
jgi:hypothetical protein